MWNNLLCISSAVQICARPIYVELCLLERVVTRALPPFRHSLGIQLSKRHRVDVVLASYADALLKIHKINELGSFLFRAIMHFFPVGGKQNWD